MAVKHGTIGEFDSGIEDWTSYTERLEQYFVANNVGEDKQTSSRLLSSVYVGPKLTYC